MATDAISINPSYFLRKKHKKALTFCIWGLRVGRQTLSGHGRSSRGRRRRHVLRFRSGSHFHGLQQPHVNDGVVAATAH